MSQHHRSKRLGQAERKAFAEAVFQRDQGVCQLCRIDTVDVLKQLRKIVWDNRVGFAKRTYNIDKARLKAACNFGGRLWDMDHIELISEDGPTTLENIRTLCVKCHKQVTRENDLERNACLREFDPTTTAPESTSYTKSSTPITSTSTEALF
jgi:5-methylcytosine-specific restriction endonuclease McrA